MRLLSELSVIRFLLIIIAFSVAACDKAPNPKSSTDDTTIPITSNAQQLPTGSVVSSEKTSVFVFLGDSLTAGFGLPSEAALPEQVEKRLRDAGLNVNVVNAGVSGDLSANGLARYDWSVKAANPDFLIIALGANDYLLGLPAETTSNNLSAILDRAKDDNIPAILVGLQPRSSAAQGSRDAEFAAIYPDLSKRFNVPLYPALLAGVRGNPKLLQADGLHPTAKGIEIMADSITPFLMSQTQ